MKQSVFICIYHHLSLCERWQADVSGQLALVEGRSNWVLIDVGDGISQRMFVCQGLCKLYMFFNHGLPWFITSFYDFMSDVDFEKGTSAPL